MMSFTWIPHTVPDEEALERLKQHFPKPSEPPPVAWFMGEKIEYFDEIINTNPDALTLIDLERYFFEACSGLRNFPTAEIAVQSWIETFNYLLPYLLPRCHEGYLLSDLIGYLFLVYPNTIPDIYPKFRADILNTLGNAIMRPMFWDENDLSQAIIQTEWDSYHQYASNDFMTTLSPAIYFCLKYLTPSEICTWAESLLQINGRYWHFSLMNWLFKETFQALVYFDREDLPPSLSVKPRFSFGVESMIRDFQLTVPNVQAFIKKLKEHNCYFSFSK